MSSLESCHHINLSRQTNRSSPTKRSSLKNNTSNRPFLPGLEIRTEFFRFGNFDILEKIYKYIPEALAGKAHLDHIIDLCGTPKEGGTGLQNLRECIVWTEEKFNFEPKLKKPFWKQMSKNFIERYCYLVVFATYLRERAPR